VKLYYKYLLLWVLLYYTNKVTDYRDYGLLHNYRIRLTYCPGTDGLYARIREY